MEEAISSNTTRRRTGLPPRNFKPAGAVRWAQVAKRVPAFALKPPKVKGRRGQGLRYERKVQSALLAQFGDYYAPGMWLRFQVHGEDKVRYCQPDGLLFQPLHRTIILVEIKLQHTPDAWWQLSQLYHPVVSALFPPSLWRFSFCEIVRWYDPATAFPAHYRLAASPLVLEPEEFGVHILKA